MDSPVQKHGQASEDEINPQTLQILQALKTASGRDILALLLRFGMAEIFLRQLKERQVVFNNQELSDPDIIHDKALVKYCKEHKLETDEDRKKWCMSLGIDSEEMMSEAIHEWRRKELRELLVTASGETLYLRYKDKLDRVLYSLLRVEDPFLCQEIYYSIEAGEITFAEASARYSCGPESKTQGIVGPVDLTTPHPEIAARLRTAQAGHLIGPFQAEDWHTLIRMEYRFDSEYDENTKSFLEDVCFKSQIGQGLDSIKDSLMEWVNSRS
ncbi:hypothetical protein EBR25_11815 [bacterium]|nr:hypothetical protein [bacterium]